MNRGFLLLFFLLISLKINDLAAQTAAIVHGDLLVSLKTGQTPERLCERLAQLNGQPTKLIAERRIAEPMNIWLLHFDSKSVDENRLLEAVWRQPEVTVAQFNHVVEFRSAFDWDEFRATFDEFSRKNGPVLPPSNIPNDPNFSNQWQYINNGASGGVVDADIDIDLAWDITTGGLTAAGDTIVVCVVDGGVNTAHPDFGNNLWKNKAEIPNNGLDDDQNGYIDDYDGWSTYTNSGVVNTNYSHGTPVCGIVGAKGNNGVGVAGVNWNVKIMVVAGGGNEANVLASYSYPYLFRKKYNESNGTKGAFVVATNSSWGTDLGQPSDAPLWCAFYDTLGKVGILSCGATANANYNIDTQGDLPTACPSDFLISVTNCGRNGKKVASAGYGTTTIDLGSFGENAYTLTSNGYGGFGGTSGATPHVTGTIGLMYSAPCSNFSSLAKTDPAAAALLVKKYILDGVKPEATLVGKTVTGGRLNTNQAILNLLAGCSACQPPFGATATALTDSSANLIFTKLNASTTANLRYRAVGAADWILLNNVQSPVSLQNLSLCTDYEFQMETDCTDSTSGWSFLTTFKTAGCCDPVKNLAAGGISANGATISWSPISAAASYVVEISANGSTVAENVAASSNSLILNNLTGCTDYTVVVKTVCADMPTAVSNSISFRTKGCGACIDNAYCSQTGSDASGEWIGKVELANLLHEATNATAGYEQVTDAKADLEQNHSYSLQLTPAFTANAYNEYFRVWMDWNQDGFFSEPAERVFDSGTAQNGLVSGTISVGANATLGTTRMRVAMKYLGTSGSKPQPCTAFNFGQVKDFCVNILPETIGSSEPTFLEKMSIEPNPFGESFDVVFELKKAGDVSFELFNSTGQVVDFQQLSSLLSGKNRVSMEAENLSAGLYFLKLKTSDGVVVRRVVKQ